MKETALDRVQRALDLIPFIAANPGLSIEEIAQRFGSTTTQISKDLTLLHMCGLPGYSHLELLDIDYENPDSISVMDAQVLDTPRSLTQVETLTLVLGLQLLLEIVTSAEEKQKIDSLLQRLSSKLNEKISSNISISDGLVDSPLVAKIREAIITKSSVSLKYNSLTSDAITTRNVLPVELEFKGGVGYLHAVVLDSRDTRTFRIDRILEFSVGQPVGDIALHVENNHHLDALIELKMGSDGLFFIEKHNEIVTSFSQVNDGYFITVTVSSLEWITRVILSWPRKIEVLEPPVLAEELKKRVLGTLENYR